MHLLFIDESATPSPPGKPGSKYFILGEVIIPEEVWPKLSVDLKRIKNDYNVTGEIKWRYFIPETIRLKIACYICQQSNVMKCG